MTYDAANLPDPLDRPPDTAGHRDSDSPFALAPADHPPGIAQAPPKVPRPVLYWAVAALLVLAIGGAVLDRVLTSATAPGTVTTGTVPGGGSAPPRPNGRAAPPETAQLHSPLSAFLGLTSLKGRQAPPLSLADASNGSVLTLAGLHGHVVVLTFTNAACNDICPVLAAELAKADSLLGTTKVPVTFLTVNSDPLELGGGGSAPVFTETGLASLPNWRFLTGSLSKLNSVWVSYGITVTADRSTGVAAHNDLLYFIGPKGELMWSAVPFADESSSGKFTLPSADETRFAQGIAHYADKLAGTS